MTLRPGATCTTRPATVADYDYLYDLHAATMRDYVARTWGWDDAVQQRMFREQLDPQRVEIIERDGQRVGMWSVEDRGDEFFLRSIEIDPAYQGLGIGTAMVSELIGRAATMGRPVSLQVLKVNPAFRLYERLGFAVIGETTTRFRMRTRVLAAHTITAT
jgi:ribosomal protein S18 acetylase RimI-like enzyme